MKKSKKNYIAIVLVVLLLALAVGYAAFSQTLTISGTANASGKWDVKFTDATITNSIVTGTEANTVSHTDTSVTVKVNLATPGDGAQIKAVITNNGSVDATLKNFNVIGMTKVSDTLYQNTGKAIQLKLPTITDGNISAGESKTFEFTVEWDTAVNSLDTAEEATFTITFDYAQDGVGNFTGTQNFQ